MKLELSVDEATILRQAIYNLRSEVRQCIKHGEDMSREFAVLTKLYELVPPDKELIITTVDH